MIDNDSNEPITLPTDAYAVVWSPTEGWMICSPVDPASNTPEPEAVALLGAGVQLEDDAQFRMKCADALKAVLDGRDVALSLKAVKEAEEREALKAWIDHNHAQYMLCALRDIARGRDDNGRPLAADEARQRARRALKAIGYDWAKEKAP